MGGLGENVSQCQPKTDSEDLRCCIFAWQIKQWHTKSAGGNNQSCSLPKNLEVLLHTTLEGPKQGHHGNCDDECNEVEGETYAHKVGKLVVAHTLHNEVGLIANGGAKTS